MSTVDLIANRKRAHFETIVSDYLAAQNADRQAKQMPLLKRKDVLVSPDFIRLEVVLKNNITSYTIDPRDIASKSDRPLIKGVKDNDLFVALDYGMFFDQRDPAKPSLALLQTCPNEEHFGANDILALYNGTHTLKLNRTNYVDRESNLIFLKHTAAAVVGTTIASAMSSFQLGNSDFAGGLVSLEPLVKISGGAENQIIVDFKSFDSINLEALDKKENVLTFIFKGYTISNGSNRG